MLVGMNWREAEKVGVLVGENTIDEDEGKEGERLGLIVLSMPLVVVSRSRRDRR